MNRTGNAKKNIFTGLLNKLIFILMPFVIKTVIIKQLGMDFLGIDNLFVSILQVLNLSELGISSAIVYCMYKPIAENDINTVCSLYNFFKKAYQIIGLIILSVGVLICPFLDKLIVGDLPTNINIYVLYLIYLFNTAISYLLFSYKNILLYANQRIDVSNNILTFVKLIMYLCQFIALIIAPNYYIYISILPIFTIINNIITSIFVNKMFPEYSPRGKVNDQYKKEIKIQVSGVFIGKVCLVTRNSFDSIIISAYFGLITTAVYNNYYYILNAVFSIMTIVCNSIVPGVGNSIAIEPQEKNYADFRKFNFIYLWLIGWSTVCLLCLYQPFIRLWLGEKFILSFGSVVLFCMYFFALMMGNIRATYSEAAGLWWQNRYRAIGESISNLVLNIILGKILGINGIILATIISIVVVNFGMSTKILFRYYFTKVSEAKYFFDTFIYAIVTLVSCIITFWICSKFSFNDIDQLIFNFVVCLIIPNIIFYLCYMRLDIFKTSKEWLKTLVYK